MLKSDTHIHSLFPQNMNSFKYTSFRLALNVDDVFANMHAIDEELRGTNLNNLRAFNYTYFIITKNVLNRLGTGYFTDDNLMRSVDTVFGNFYFEALHGYINNDKCPLSWKLLFDTCKENSFHQFVYMALGVNAHVNNDLPQTLQLVHRGDMNKDDFDKINEIIGFSLKEVISSLHEKSLLLSKIQNISLFFYKPILTQLIRNWRDVAWDNYCLLNEKKRKVNDIELEASIVAKKLLTIKHVYDLPKVITTLYLS